jgi:hypothetical protein
MALAGKAVMINWSNVAPEHRERYYDWHDREHIAGRLQVPGFLRGRRHLAIEADRTIFNMYEVRDLNVLTSEPYTRLTNQPSEATRATSKLITDAFRALAHVRYTSGQGSGACVQTLRFEARPGADTGLQAYLCDIALPELSTRPGVVGVHLCVADQAASGVVSAERKGRPTVVPGYAVIVEGTTVAAVRAAVEQVLPAARLRDAGADDTYTMGTYGLQIIMTREEAGAPPD